MLLTILSLDLLLILQIQFANIVSSASVQNAKETEEKVYKSILDKMDASRIKENLRYLTEYPHHPGSKRNSDLAKYLQNEWESSGFDKTEMFRYNIYMSYPESPGEISLLRSGKLEKKLVIENEPPLDESEKKGIPLYPFNAFSARGSVTAEYIYGGYGRGSDFRKLKSLGIDVAGKILILRYSKGSRSGKVRRAERLGAVGVILYTDPYDYNNPGEEYPNGWMLNRYAVQRGTINRLSGDALSQGYPSKPGYFRISEQKYSGNPGIPSQPISYSTAYEILTSMKDDSIPLPTGFQGGLNFTYVLQSGKTQTLTLKVSTKLETRESLTVCTTLYGSTEPDRYVMLGNHRDSWTYGASDPSSGTAAMMEIVRTLGKVKKTTGWRPRRSLMMCSWGGEEPGILGSTEWTDENHKFITNNVAAYLNVDMAVEGNFTVRMKSLKFVGEGIYRISKLINAPDDSKKTLYDDWLAKSSILASKKIQKPKIITPRSGSDYKAFWHTYGTTIADFRYLFSKKDYPRLSANGHYHTRYESFGWMSKFVDPQFKYHLTVARLMGGHALLIADSTIIPFDLVTYMKQVKYFFNQLEVAYRKMLKANKISLKFARKRLDALVVKAKKFHEYIKSLDMGKTSSYELRSINDKLMNFERNFIIKGISKKVLSARHVVYASNPFQLQSTRFPGISEAIYFASKSRRNDWDEVRKQITLVVWCFDTANRSLDISEWNHLH